MINPEIKRYIEKLQDEVKRYEGIELGLAPEHNEGGTPANYSGACTIVDLLYTEFERVCDACKPLPIM